jgi:predicted nuclease of predicted toxin-antitoxin system
MGRAPASSFLADINISPQTVEALKQHGWDIVRVSAFLPSRSPDTVILDHAFQGSFAIVTQDLDFSTLVALSGRSRPSLITLRLSRSDPETITRKLLELALYPLDQMLSEGVAITIEDSGVRFRKLPIKPSKPKS